MSKPVEIFIAYSRRDSELLKELRIHLTPLERSKRVTVWYDGKIEPGDVWEDSIKRHLHGADIVLLLVSADSIASDYFYDKEVSDALVRHHQGSAKVVPLILRPCAWRETPLADLQALPQNGKPVTEWASQDGAYTNAVEALARMIDQVEDARKEKEAAERQSREAAEAERVAAERRKQEATRRQAEADEQQQRQEKELQARREQERRDAYLYQIREAEQQRLAREKAADDAWEITRLAETKPPYEAFIKKYGDSRHVGDARKRIAAIDKAAADKAAADKSSTGSATPGGGTTTKPPPSSLPTAIQKLENDMVPVTGGTFTMGWESTSRDGSGYDDEKPAHQVSVRNFSIGRYEVTQAQWRAVMGSDPPELYNKGCDQCPVEGVSWNDIQDFLKKLNSLTGKRYRLPTEAEWEYAARGGNQSRGYLYSGGNNIETVAWYTNNYKSGNTYGEQKSTRPVGGKSANELGLYDMSGNVWEWCEDDWHGNYQGAPTDGRAWMDSPRGSYRVFRGGSWFNYAEFCRAAYRSISTPTLRYFHVGFRLVLQ